MEISAEDVLAVLSNSVYGEKRKATVVRAANSFATMFRKLPDDAEELGGGEEEVEREV